jgi:hypothetical protein
VFDAGDTEAFVSVVAELYGVRTDRRGDDIHLRSPT